MRLLKQKVYMLTQNPAFPQILYILQIPDPPTLPKSLLFEIPPFEYQYDTGDQTRCSCQRYVELGRQVIEVGRERQH